MAPRGSGLWRNLVLVVFFNPERSWTAALFELPPVLDAAASAIAVFAGIWL